jgi:hypothetical protein
MYLVNMLEQFYFSGFITLSDKDLPLFLIKMLNFFKAICLEVFSQLVLHLINRTYQVFFFFKMKLQVL